MKPLQKLTIAFTLIIIGLLITISLLVFSKNNIQEKDPNHKRTEEFQLMEVQHQPKIVLSGVIKPLIVEEVRMKISGTIDGKNRTLSVGSKFKKNEILIKADRLDAIYALLTARSEYKSLIQKLILSIKDEAPNEFDKWSEFDNKIQKTIPLPDLPSLKSKKEELLVNKLNVIGEYYKTKNAERKIEDYIYLAPFDGMIIESRIEPGLSFQSGKTILKLAKNNTFEFLAYAKPNNLNRISNKDTIALKTPAGNRLGDVIFLRTGATTQDSLMVEVYFSILSTNQNLFNERAEVHYPGRPAVIPNKAIQNNSVRLFNDDKIYKTSVSIIKEIGDSSVIEGLPEHCFVIVKDN